MRTIIALLLVALISVVGCGPKKGVESSAQIPEGPQTGMPPQAPPSVASSAPTGNAAVDSVAKGTADVEALQDLNDPGLDNLDKDMQNINW